MSQDIPEELIPKEVSEATIRKARIAAAFEKVFGQPEMRGDDQKLVWQALEARGYYRRPIFSFEKGTTDPVTAAHRDGARTLVLSIERELEHARANPADKPKPKSKRK